MMAKSAPALSMFSDLSMKWHEKIVEMYAVPLRRCAGRSADALPPLRSTLVIELHASLGLTLATSR